MVESNWGQGMNNGIIYIADGEGFAGQCLHSINLMRTRCKLHPPIKVMTTHPDFFEQDKTALGIIGVERIEPANGLQVKTINMNKTPFKRTLFLDTDTIVLNDQAWEPFKILNRYDFAMVHAPARGFNVMRKVPNCVPSWNSGVVFMNNASASKVQDVLRRYKNGFKPVGPRTSEQAWLSKIVWNMKANVFTLPPEYNCRGKESGVPTPSMLRIIHHHKAFKLLKRGLTVDEVARRFATNASGI